MSIPDYCEAITGHRMWTISEDYNLYGYFYSNYLWPSMKASKAFCCIPYINMDFSSHEGHDSPQINCTCGIYAYDNNEKLYEGFVDSLVNRTYLRSDIIYTTIGEIKLWGKVIKHKYGYRAEYAYPSKLYVFDKNLIKSLQDKYKVPIELVQLNYFPPSIKCRIEHEMYISNKRYHYYDKNNYMKYYYLT